MQTSVPELMDLGDEPKHVLEEYGNGDFARHCVYARRLAERGVRFIELFNADWDSHSNQHNRLTQKCREVDQPTAALVKDLKQRGLLDSTIVMWTGEFGRLPVSQGADGRDHNRHAFSLWVAGGGFKRGLVYGATDDFGYAAVENVMPVHDFHATLLHTLGLDHRALTYQHDGRPTSLTDPDVTDAKVVKELLA